MNIIDKTDKYLRDWKVGDEVHTADGKKGLIQARSDGEFAIVRLDTTHHGDFCKGLIYDFAQSTEELQKNNPEFCKDEVDEWNPGDFVKNGIGKIGLIVMDDECRPNIVQTDGDKKFSTVSPYAAGEDMEDLRATFSEWHRVPSKTILGGDSND